MSLKLKYFLFIIIIHLLIAYLFYLLLEEGHRLYFLLAEVGILISLFLSYLLFRALIQPLDFLSSGTDAIRDRDFNVKYLRTGSREMDKLINVYNEMIDSIREERTQAEEQHYFLQKLIQASPNGIILLDYDNRITDINPRAADLLLWKNEWMQKDISTIRHPLLQQIAQIKSGQSTILQHGGAEKYKCEVSTFVHRGFQKKFILVQELSKEILAAEKRAYGKVIRMMAHEVNNSIGAINSILNSTLEYNQESSDKMDEDIKEALKAAVERNHSLNEFMSNFAKVVRLPKPHLELSEVNEICLRIIALMTPLAKKRSINIQQQLHPSPIRLSLDAKQIEQALVNIFKNAMEALETEGNTIRIESYGQPRPRIVISDNGCGINPEISAKLFTPFFSTKMTGQGVGLTLVRDILLQHDAQFSLQTEEGWTKFEVLF